MRLRWGRPPPRGSGAHLARGLQLHCGADTLCVQLEEGARRPRGTLRISELTPDGIVEELQTGGRGRLHTTEGAVQERLDRVAVGYCTAVLRVDLIARRTRHAAEGHAALRRRARRASRGEGRLDFDIQQQVEATATGVKDGDVWPRVSVE